MKCKSLVSPVVTLTFASGEDWRPSDVKEGYSRLISGETVKVSLIFYYKDEFFKLLKQHLFPQISGHVFLRERPINVPILQIIPEYLYNLNHRVIDESELPPTSTTIAPTTKGYYEFPQNSRGNGHRVRKFEYKEFVDEDAMANRMLASSKALVQLMGSLFVGPLINRIGYTLPMFAGFMILLTSTLIFAFCQSYPVCILARGVHGISASCTFVAGMGLLADRFPNDKKRGKVMSVALGGFALAILIGPTYGVSMYRSYGGTLAFLILACVALGAGILQCFILKPRVVRPKADAVPLRPLLTDPYILVTAGAIAVSNMSVALLEISLPIWIMDNFDAPLWQLRVVSLPIYIAYCLGISIFGGLGYRIGRWVAATIGLCLIGICLICVPFVPSVRYLIGPIAGLGFGLGMVHSCLIPELGHLVDIRHGYVYGTVYAIGSIAYYIPFAFHAVYSYTFWAFQWEVIGIGILQLLYAPALFMLRAPPVKINEQNRGTLEEIEQNCPINNFLNHRNDDTEF